MLTEDEIAALYTEDYYGEPGTKFRPLVERLVRAVAARHIAFLSRGLAPGARILDVGCGRGVLFGPLADAGFRVYGVEVNEEAVRGCDARAEVRVAPELSRAEFDDGQFDLVVIWHVLEHLPAPAETIAECHRILKPGGRLIFLDSLQLGDQPDYDGLLERFPVAFHEPYYADYIRHDLAAPFAAAGLKVEQVETVYLSRLMVLAKA
jgi:SAM-dependent methyltransferase